MAWNPGRPHNALRPLPSPILYLSRFIIAHKEDYYRHLLSVTSEGVWEPWLLFMLEAVEETSAWTTEKIGAVRGLARHTREWVRDRLPRVYSRELVDVLFEQPYCRIANVVDADLAPGAGIGPPCWPVSPVGAPSK